MTLIHTPLRTLALLTLALAGCLPGSQSLGDDDGDATDTDTDTDGPPGEPAEVRWSTIRPDITGTDIAVAPDGSFYVFGQSGYHPEGDGGYYDDRWLGKYDANGVLLWETFEPQAEDDFVYPVAVSVDDAGDVYLALIDYDVTLDGDNRVTKLDADGNELWSTVMPGRLGELVALPGGGAIAVGSQDGAAWAQQLDTSGNLGWARTFDGVPMSYSEVTEVALTSDGGVVLGGRLGLEAASSRSQAWAATLELADGADRWQTSLSDGVITDHVMDVGVAADGTTLVAGWSDERWVKALDPSGALQWTWINDLAPGTSSLAVFPDGGFAVGDGRFLEDLEDPNGCWGPSSPCPVAMRIARLEADRSLRWFTDTNACNSADVLRPTTDGGVLMLATCKAPGTALGVFRFEP